MLGKSILLTQAQSAEHVSCFERDFGGKGLFRDSFACDPKCLEGKVMEIAFTPIPNCFTMKLI